MKNRAGQLGVPYPWEAEKGPADESYRLLAQVRRPKGATLLLTSDRGDSLALLAERREGQILIWGHPAAAAAGIYDSVVLSPPRTVLTPQGLPQLGIVPQLRGLEQLLAEKVQIGDGEGGLEGHAPGDVVLDVAAEFGLARAAGFAAGGYARLVDLTRPPRLGDFLFVADVGGPQELRMLLERDARSVARCHRHALLAHAALAGSAKLADVLWELGPFYPEALGACFVLACGGGRLKAARWLAERRRPSLPVLREAVKFASIGGAPAAVKWLFEGFVKTEPGFPAELWGKVLVWAAGGGAPNAKGNVRLARMALKSGDARAEDVALAFEAACYAGHSELVALLLAGGAGPSPLCLNLDRARGFELAASQNRGAALDQPELRRAALGVSEPAFLFALVCQRGFLQVAQVVASACRLEPAQAGEEPFRLACLAGRAGVAEWLWREYGAETGDLGRLALRLLAAGEATLANWLMTGLGVEAYPALSSYENLAEVCRSGSLRAVRLFLSFVGKEARDLVPLAKRARLILEGTAGSVPLADWLAAELVLEGPGSPAEARKGAALGHSLTAASVSRLLERGHTEVLTWALERGARLPRRFFSDLRLARRQLLKALESGNERSLAWLLREPGAREASFAPLSLAAPEKRRADKLLLAAANRGERGVLEEFLAKHPPAQARRRKLARAAASGGHLALALWLAQREAPARPGKSGLAPPPKNAAARRALAGGHFDAASWLEETA